MVVGVEVLGVYSTYIDGDAGFAVVIIAKPSATEGNLASGVRAHGGGGQRLS